MYRVGACLQVWEYSECLAEMDHACTLAAVPPVRVQWAAAGETPQATIARSDLYTLHTDCLPDSLLVLYTPQLLVFVSVFLAIAFQTISETAQLRCPLLTPPPPPLLAPRQYHCNGNRVAMCRVLVETVSML